jgi:hypothetical protein
LSRRILSLLVLNLDIYQKNPTVWLGGDFNLGGIEWHNYSIKSKAQNTKQCKQLLDICQDNCLEQVVNEETHFTEKFTFLGLILALTYTISWSDIPGITSTLLISELLLVKNKSRMDFDFSVK